MVPEGWKVKQLADICSKQISYGIVQTGEHQPNGIPCLRVVDLTKDEMHPEEMIRTSVEIHESYRKTILEKDEIVMALRGEVGLVRQIDTKLVGANITRGLARISAKPHIVAPEFLLWELRSPKFRADLMRRVGGSALQEISLSELRKVQTLIPPLPEQKKIAQILSTWDKAITTTEQLLANSQQQKKALMQQLLTGKKRLLNKNGVRFSGEWKKCTLSSFGKSIRGVSYKPENISEKESKDTIRLLRSTNIQNGNLNDKDLVILPKELVKPNQTLEKGDLAICMANGSKALVGKSAPFEGSDITYTVGAFCAIFRPLSENNAKFVKFLFESSQYQSQLLMILAGSSINNLKGSDIESIKIFTPICLEEQQKIATVLSTADQEITALQHKLEALKQEKKALMQQLLTGKRRVKIDNKEVA